MSIKNQIKIVQDADSAESLLKAVEELAATCDQAAIPTLIEVLGYNNPGAAVAAVEGLIQLGEVAVPSILNQLDGYNYGARAWAIRALAGIGDIRGLDLLLDSAKHDFSPSVRRGATKGLGNLLWEQFSALEVINIQKSVFLTLIKVLSDAEWIVRYACVNALESLSKATKESKFKQEIIQQLKNQLEQEMDAVVQERIKLVLERIK